MNTNIGLPDSHRQAVAQLLNTLLADEFILYTKTRNAHWNIEGPSFLELHKLFEGQYEELEEIIDKVAERTRFLGHYAISSLKDFIAVAHLGEEKTSYSNERDAVQLLLNDHETIIRFLRNAINQTMDEFKDSGSADFFTGLMEIHEKTAWMLRSYLA
jgi:starvation-inducible DNA-binding protein